jgi:hypothetical protein
VLAGETKGPGDLFGALGSDHRAGLLRRDLAFVAGVAESLVPIGDQDVVR